MSTVPLFRALFAGAVSMSALPLSAQVPDAQPMPVGRTVDGTLTRDLPTLNERGRFRVYRVEARQGQRYSLLMRADAFDSYVSVARQVNGLTDYLASDDDGAGNSNARLRWTPKVSGSYYIIAQSLKDDGLGDFTVKFDTLPATIITPPRAIALGTPLEGVLAETDPSVDGNGSFHDLYRVRATRGQRLVISMVSKDFDSVLGIGRMVGDSLAVDETDDDGGGENHARLRFTAKEDGEYIIRAQGIDANQLGAYTITVTERAVVNNVPVALAPNTTVTGELTESDETAADESSFDAYTFTGRAGERVTITMMSSALDSYLVIGRLVNGEFEQIAYDDDGGEGNDSKLEQTLEQAGEYVIRANCVGSGKTGSYRIRLERSGAGAAARPATRPVAPVRRP